MSRAYRMTVSISGYNQDRGFEVMHAAEEESCISLEGRNPLYGFGETSLGGGQSEEDYVRRVTHAAWIANRGYCDVVITCCNLDNAPAYQMGKDEFHAVEDAIAVIGGDSEC